MALAIVGFAAKMYCFPGIVVIFLRAATNLLDNKYSDVPTVTARLAFFASAMLIYDLHSVALNTVERCVNILRYSSGFSLSNSVPVSSLTFFRNAKKYLFPISKYWFCTLEWKGPVSGVIFDPVH